MTHEILSRADAYAHSKRFYFTGKACRNGHIAERYTSGGNCVVCLADIKVITEAKNKMAKRQRNAMLAKDDFSYTLTIPFGWVDTFKQLQELAPHCSPEQADRIKAAIASMHKEAHNPFVSPVTPLRPTRAVNRDDILRIVRWNGTTVTNMPELDITDTDGVRPVLIRIGLEQYEGELVMQCLRGALAVVPPYAAS